MDTSRETDPGRNLVRAVAVLGALLVLAAAVAGGAFYLAMDHAAGRLERALDTGSREIRAAGERIGGSGDRLTGAVEAAGKTIGQPEVRITKPIPIQQPLSVRGQADDGALPVNARLAK